MKNLLKILHLTSLIIAVPSFVYAGDAPVSLRIQNKKFDSEVNHARESNENYLNALIEKADRLKLHEHIKWRMLVHYKSNVMGGYTSEVDGDDFFLSASGKSDPKAELQATLASFFSDQPHPQIKLTPQCRFVARFFWLNQKLSFDPEKLVIQECPKFSAFRQGVNAASITIIFPSAHPHGPASMFGHTSLKIDKVTQTPETRMLDYTLNFAAMAGTERGIGYALKGLTGLFKGQYTILPYYSKIREYAQMESRDIWEYTLDLSQEQVDFIVMHAYELSPTYYDYYFFTENCSYHLLTLIESSMNTPDLTEDFSGWVIPVDTLKSLDKNNVIRSTRYLPSLSTKIQYRRNQLSEQENALTYKLLENGLEAHADELQSLAVDRQAKLLDLLYEYMRYIKIDETNRLDTTITEGERAVLVARSKLGVPSEPLEIPKPLYRPDQGHGTSRIRIENVKKNDRSSFRRFSWRSTYHGLMDPSRGYTPNYQLEFFNVQLSNEKQSGEYRLDRFEVLNIVSLAPRDDVFKNISWRFKTGLNRIFRSSGSTDSIYYLDVGLGITYKNNYFKQSFVYGFIDLEIDHNDNRYNRTLFSTGPSIGVLTELNDVWKAHLEVGAIVQNDPARTRFERLLFRQSIAIAKNFSINLDIEKTTGDNNTVNEEEITFSLNVFH